MRGLRLRSVIFRKLVIGNIPAELLTFELCSKKGNLQCDLVARGGASGRVALLIHVDA